MSKKRKNIYFTDKQVERLEKKSQQENLPEAEIVRRALDAYLAWDDSTYVPCPCPNKEQLFIPDMNDGAFKPVVL
jgi:hypothetical protein